MAGCNAEARKGKKRRAERRGLSGSPGGFGVGGCLFLPSIFREHVVSNRFKAWRPCPPRSSSTGSHCPESRWKCMWLAFAFGTALLEAIKDVLSKRALRTLDIYSVAFAMPLFALPLFIPALFFNQSIPVLNTTYWLALLAAGSLHVLALTLYMEALKSSPLAVTLPLISFTPLFMLLTSPFMIGEIPSVLGGIGVILIVSGTYILNIKRIDEGLAEPIKALLRERGSRAMFAVAIIWAITGNIDRIGIRNSNMLFWLTTMLSYTSIGFLIVLWYKGKLATLRTKEFYTLGAIAGVFNGLSLICYMEALSLTLVTYVVSVKRSSIIIGILLGYFFLGERNIRERLFGAVLMLFGVLCIGFS